MDEASLKAEVAASVGIIETSETFEQVFSNTRLLGENAIPVPKDIGLFFAEKFEEAKKHYADFHKDWKIAMDEFVNTGSIRDAENKSYPSENFVRTVVQSIIDLTYMQNPKAEFSNNAEIDEQAFTNLLTKLITTIINRAGSEGLNLRPHVLRQIVFAHLTNFGILKLCYTPQTGSRQDAQKLYDLTKKKLLDKETSTEDIGQLRELLAILHREINDRSPSGIHFKVVWPTNFYPDPEAVMDDLSDAKFAMEIEMLSEAYLQSQYMTYDVDMSQWKFRYDPSIVYGSKQNMKDVAASTAEEIVDALPSDLSEDAQKVKVKNKVPCLWIHDKMTNQIYLYILGRWDSPLWVFENELNLSRFFPYFILSMSPGLSSIAKKSEASYYIPFQRAENETTKQIEVIRNAAFSTIIYDKQSIDGKEVERVLKVAQKKTDGLRSIGVDIKDKEKSLRDMLQPLIMPVAQMEALFSSTRYRSAIDKASRLNEAMRGAEFKTNTTNDAINAYQQFSNVRLSSLIDKIEETIAQVLWAVAEVVVSQYTKEAVAQIVGANIAADFKNLNVADFNQQYSMEIEAGSIEKPSSDNKKKEAMSIIQMLGQFGASAPKTVLSVVGRLLNNIFSSKLWTETDSQNLTQEAEAAMAKGVSVPQGE